MDEGNVLDLAPEAVHEGEARLGASVVLALVVDILGNLLLEHLGDLGALEDAVLAEGEEGLEKVVADGEADDELLPGEERTVKGPREALRGVSFGRVTEVSGASWAETKELAHLEEIHGS